MAHTAPQYAHSKRPRKGGGPPTPGGGAFLSPGCFLVNRFRRVPAASQLIPWRGARTEGWKYPDFSAAACSPHPEVSRRTTSWLPQGTAKIMAAALHWLFLRFWVAWKWVPRVLFTSLLRAGLWEYLPRSPSPGCRKIQHEPAGFAAAKLASSTRRCASVQDIRELAQRQRVSGSPNNRSAPVSGIPHYGSLSAPPRGNRVDTNPSSTRPGLRKQGLKSDKKRKSVPMSPRPHGVPTMSLDLWASVTLPASGLAPTKGPSACPS